MEIRSIVHDLNNALTTILGYSEWLLNPGVDRAKCERELQTIHNSAKHAAELARELREWMRRTGAASPTLPLPFPQPPAFHAGDAPRLPDGVRRILVVDDQPDVLESVKDMLAALGHVVAVASSGREALELLKVQSFDVVFTDLSMPDVDGLTLAERARIIRPNVPVVLLTGWGSELDEPCEAVRLVLAKPVTLGSLRDAVSRMAA